MRDLTFPIMCCLVAILCLVAIMLTHEPSVRLVGYGCTGAGGPLYAQEEDHFPACDRIERR